MAGGTLVVSRTETLHSHYKKRFEDLGFSNVTITAVDRDGLDMLIDEMRPGLVIIGAGFFKSALIYKTGCLLRRHKGINIAIVSTGPEPYPPDIAMMCIINGVKSYIAITDGIKQFYEGLNLVKDGKCYVSPSVLERIEVRDELPEPSDEVTEKEMEVLRLVRNGFTGAEIAETLAVSLATVNFHKRELYRNLGVRNENELIRVSDDANLIKDDGRNFYSGTYELSPKPKNREKRTKNKEKIRVWRKI